MRRKIMDIQQLSGGENKTTEFKREYTDELKKTLVAFANTDGGTLYIGVNDDGSIVGVADPDKTMLQLSNSANLAIKPDVTMFVDYRKETIEGKDIIVVTVQKGTAYETYENVRSLNQDLTFTEAEQFFKERDLAFGVEQQKTLHIQTTDGIYTNLGLLLSDQSPHTIKMAVFEGLEKEVFKDRKEFTGSILRQLSHAYDFLDMYNHTFAKIKGLYREDMRDYPEEALREALLNALVHRDYSFSASTLISIFDDRIEFVSIGGLMKGITINDIMLGISVSRNPNLANLFYRLHLIEVYGTGIQKIMRSYEGQRKQPLLVTSDNGFKIVLPNRTVNSTSARQDTDEHTKDILALFEKQPVIQRRDVEQAFGIPPATVGRLLKKMVENGLVKVLGAGKNTRYEKV
jgi:ATP-dependent DNA helicase RecG